MKPVHRLILGLVLIGVGYGCGSSSSLNTAPLTEEQQKMVQQEDAIRDREEGGQRKAGLPTSK